MKVGLYSITYLGAWYDGPALTSKEVLHKAKELGYDGVEFDAKRPHGNPMDWDERTRAAVRNEAEKLGLELPAVSANNDFSSPVPEHRECQLLMVREQARLTADIGAKALRVFAAWPGPTGGCRLMEKMCTFTGLFIGSSLGGWLGAQMGLMMMVVLSSVGAGFGFYFGRRLFREYLD